MSLADVERLLREFAPGDRVRAALDVFYADSGIEIEEGEEGVIAERNERVSPLYAIVWDSHPGVRCWTVADAFDLVTQ